MNSKNSRTQNKSQKLKIVPFENQKNKPGQRKPQQKVIQLDVEPQKRSKKSKIGSSYNDGFDCVSGPERRVTRVEHFDELIATVNGSVAFATTQYPINPGNSTSFPRLSNLAKLFEKYIFEELEVYFQHDVSQFNSQGAAGLVIISGLYDAASAAPTSKSQVEVTDPHVISMPNQNALCRFNKDRLHPKKEPLFVRIGNKPGGTDIKTYDAGNIFISTQGMAGATEVGELHVRGRVRFIGDILDSSSTNSPQNNSYAQFVSSSNESLTSTVELIAALATERDNGLQIVNNAGSFTVPAGNYLMQGDFRATYSGSGTILSMVLYKNGSGIGSGPSTNTFSAGSQTIVTLNNFGYVESDGNDVFTMGVTATFSTGTCVGLGCLAFLAV